MVAKSCILLINTAGGATDMDIALSRPELFNIVDEQTAKTSFGGNQAWYSTEWKMSISLSRPGQWG